ncbi:MAG: hypothetical protein KatS3mg076_3183 [Candidatus Binatia bacterium]|nr:MAG: hypothetical protein KatS3mg076_3183 [Candidatus Binatia bacterium]
MNSGAREIRRWTALVLAGTRPGGDWATREHGAPKALVEFCGRPMLAWVLEALEKSGVCREIFVAGVDEDELRKHPSLAPWAASIRCFPAAETPSTTVAEFLEGRNEPVLLTTADHPLLRPETIRYFCERARGDEAQVFVGVVPETIVARAFPAAKRTYARFREGGFSGANLFAFTGTGGGAAARAWREVERYRKQPWKLVRALGLFVLVRFLLHRISLAEMASLVSCRIGVQIRPVPLCDPEAAFDVDTQEDFALAEKVLGERLARAQA